MGRYDQTRTFLEGCKCGFLFQVLAIEVCSICKNSLRFTLNDLCTFWYLCYNEIFKILQIYAYHSYLQGEGENSFQFQVATSLRKLELCHQVLFPFPHLKEAATLLGSPPETLYVAQEKILQLSASLTRLKNTKSRGALSSSVHFQEKQPFPLPALCPCACVRVG